MAAGKGFAGGQTNSIVTNLKKQNPVRWARQLEGGAHQRRREPRGLRLSRRDRLQSNSASHPMHGPERIPVLGCLDGVKFV